MQVTETLAEGLKHEFKISVPASDLDAKAGAKLVDLKDKVKLQRLSVPARLPVSHLEEGVWGRSVMAETIDQTISRHQHGRYSPIAASGLRGEPKIHDADRAKKRSRSFSPGKTDLTYTVAIEGGADDFSLPTSSRFSVEKGRWSMWTDAEVGGEAIQAPSPNRTALMPPKAEGAKADSGDRVTISFKGSIDGVPFDGRHRARGIQGRDRAGRPVHSGF